MKKLIAMITAMLLMATLCACAATPTEPEATAEPTATAVPTKQPTPEPTEEPAVSTPDPYNEVPGVIETEVGSIGDYNGWWKSANEELPFAYMHMEYDVLEAYTEEGEIVGYGYGDYDEQRHLNGNPLMVFEFEEFEYGVSAGAGENPYLSLTPIDLWSSGVDAFELEFVSEAPFERQPESIE